MLQTKKDNCIIHRQIFLVRLRDITTEFFECHDVWEEMWQEERSELFFPELAVLFDPVRDLIFVILLHYDGYTFGSDRDQKSAMP
jgi:hypothetical protein